MLEAEQVLSKIHSHVKDKSECPLDQSSFDYPEKDHVFTKGLIECPTIKNLAEESSSVANTELNH